MDEVQAGGRLGPTVVLVPDTRRAAAWAAAALCAVGLGVWLVVVARAGVLAWGLLAVSALLAHVLVQQAVVPGRSSLVVDERGVRGWQAGRRVDIDFHGYVDGHVQRRLGEPVLVLRAADGRTRTVVLPLGSDPAPLAAVVQDLVVPRRPGPTRPSGGAVGGPGTGWPGGAGQGPGGRVPGA